MLRQLCPPVSLPKPSGPPQPVFPDRDPTTIPVTVTADLKPLMQQINSALPTGEDADGAWGVIDNDFAGNVGLKYKVWRGEPAIAASADGIKLSLDLFYHAAIAQRVRNGIFVGGYSWHEVASCGFAEGPRRVHIELTYHLNWQSNYHLVGSWERHTDYSRCHLTVINYDVTPRVQAIIDPKSDDAAKRLLVLLQNVDFRSQVEALWSALRTPIKSTDLAGTLNISPQKIGVTPLGGSGSTLTDTFIVSAYPNVFQDPGAGNGPPADVFQGPSALPNLELMSPSSDARFRVNVAEHLPFSKATMMAKQELDGKKITYSNLNFTIAVQEVCGNSRLAFVKLRLDGDLQGSVYLTGDMAYDPATYIFSIQHLQLTPAEVSDFTQAVVASMQDPTFLASVEQKLRWPLQGRIASIKDEMNKRMQNVALPSGFRLQGGVTDLEPTFIAAYPEPCDPVFPPETCIQDVTVGAFMVTVRASGKLSISK
jgi:hypothetical protein